MATLNEGRHAGEFIGERALGDGYHNDVVNFASGSALSAGSVVGVITASGLWDLYDDSLTTGLQTAAGILYDNLPASGSQRNGVVVMRRGPAQVNRNDLVFKAGQTLTQQNNGIADLLALGIKAV